MIKISPNCCKQLIVIIYYLSLYLLFTNNQIELYIKDLNYKYLGILIFYEQNIVILLIVSPIYFITILN